MDGEVFDSPSWLSVLSEFGPLAATRLWLTDLWTPAQMLVFVVVIFAFLAISSHEDLQLQS